MTAELQLLNEIIGDCDAAGWPFDSLVTRRVASIRANAMALRAMVDGLERRVEKLEDAVFGVELITAHTDIGYVTAY